MLVFFNIKENTSPVSYTHLDTGVIIRTAVANISQTGRATQGVKVMRLDDSARIVTFALVEPEEVEQASEDQESGDN